MKKTLFALLLMLALLLALPALAQEPAAEAQDITDLCTFTPSNAKSDLPKMRDGKYKHRVQRVSAAGGRLYARAPAVPESGRSPCLAYR